MDIHRCRFIPYPASPINTLSFSHCSNVSHRAPRTLRLAVGRANGDIEIWNPRAGIWLQERILHGRPDRSIEGLAWTQDPTKEDENGQHVGGQLRLFSIGYSTAVTEWDLATGKPVRQSAGNHGEIWCLESQPRLDTVSHGDDTLENSEKNHQKLAVGCADGAVVLHSTAENDLRYLRTLPPPSNKKARVLSLAWQNCDKLVAGYSDSAVRVFDIRGKGRVLQTLSLGSSIKRGAQESLVWTVKCLPDGTIVTGDSSGEIKIWDKATLSLTQRLKSHNADILSLVISLDGSTMVSGGIDRRTVVYRRINISKTQTRWAEINHRRLHASDVKTMAAYESKNFSVTVSGGLDATAIVLPLEGLGQEHHRRLAVHPNQPPLLSAPSHRLVLSYWGTEVRLWRLGHYDTHHSSDNQPDSTDLTHKLVAKLSLKGDESITSVTLAADGSMLSVATLSTTKLFRLQPTSMNGLNVQKIKTPKVISQHGGTLVEFSPDTKWLLQIRPDSSPVLFRVCWDTSAENYVCKERPVKLERKDRAPPNLKASEGSHGEYSRCIQRVAWSTNSRVLVACDMRGAFDTWVLEGQEDPMQGDDNLKENGSHRQSQDASDTSSDDGSVVVFGQHWTRLIQNLPKLGCAPLVLAFRPGPKTSSEDDSLHFAPHPTRHNPHPHSLQIPRSEDRLIVVSSKHQLFEYHVMTGSLTDWSRRNPPESLPLDFQNIRERAMGFIWDSRGQSERFWLYGSSWLWMFDISTDMPDADATTSSGVEPLVHQSKKRKRGRDAKEDRLLMQHTSGAGSRISGAEHDMGLQPIVSVTNGVDADQTLPELQDGKHAGDDQDYLSTTKTLIRLRRAEEEKGFRHQSNGATNGDVSMLGTEEQPVSLAKKHLFHWGTFKYRPILGIVPIASGGLSEEPRNGDNAFHNNIEVALVERPLWDVDLPNRWEGDQEWNR